MIVVVKVLWRVLRGKPPLPPEVEAKVEESLEESDRCTTTAMDDLRRLNGMVRRGRRG